MGFRRLHRQASLFQMHVPAPRPVLDISTSRPPPGALGAASLSRSGSSQCPSVFSAPDFRFVHRQITACEAQEHRAANPRQAPRYAPDRIGLPWLQPSKFLRPPSSWSFRWVALKAGEGGGRAAPSLVMLDGWVGVRLYDVLPDGAESARFADRSGSDERGALSMARPWTHLAHLLQLRWSPAMG